MTQARAKHPLYTYPEWPAWLHIQSVGPLWRLHAACQALMSPLVYIYCQFPVSSGAVMLFSPLSQ